MPTMTKVVTIVFYLDNLTPEQFAVIDPLSRNERRRLANLNLHNFNIACEDTDLYHICRYEFVDQATAQGWVDHWNQIVADHPYTAFHSITIEDL